VYCVDDQRSLELMDQNRSFSSLAHTRATSPLVIRPGARLGSGSQSWLSMAAGATATSETATSGIAILTIQGSQVVVSSPAFCRRRTTLFSSSSGGVAVRIEESGGPTSAGGCDFKSSSNRWDLGAHARGTASFLRGPPGITIAAPFREAG